VRRREKRAGGRKKGEERSERRGGLGTFNESKAEWRCY